MYRDFGKIACELQWASLYEEDWERFLNSFDQGIRRRLWEVMSGRRMLEVVTFNVTDARSFRFRWAPEDEFIAAMMEAQTKGVV